MICFRSEKGLVTHTAYVFETSVMRLWFQGIIQLEKELAYLGSVCAAALMKKDLALPIGKSDCFFAALEEIDRNCNVPC